MLRCDLLPERFLPRPRMLCAMKKFLVFLLIVGVIGVVYKMVVEKEA